MKIFVILFLFAFSLQSDDKKENQRIHLTPKIDKSGRTYHQRWDGEYVFKIDKNYYSVVPHVEDISIHSLEAIELEKSKKILESVYLRKNLKLCFTQLDENKNTIYSNIIKENSISLGKLVSYYNDRLKNKEYLLDTNFCRSENGITYTSMEFSFKSLIPNQFKTQVFSKIPVKEGETSESKWRILSLTSKDENPSELTLENALETWENEDINSNKNKVNLTIAFSKHKLDFINKEYLEEYWDSKRGLSSLQKNITKFIRNTNKNINEIEYIHNIGNTSTKMQGFELYFFKEKTGISIFFSFPLEKKEEQIEIWNSFKNSIFYRGIQYSDEKNY
jgi:hypothetical protein